MSEDERENSHNKKQKMKSAVQQEEELNPTVQELLAQMNASLIIPQKPRNPRVPIERASAGQSTDPIPLQHEYIEQGGEISSSSVAVQANQNMPQSSNVARRRKKVATRKNKGIAIEEVVVLPKRKRPNNLKLPVPIPKGTAADSEYDPSSDEYTDESDKDYIP